MRFYEYRQSNTSPLKYCLELTPDELDQVKDMVMKIVHTILEQQEKDKEQSHHKDEDVSVQWWIEYHSDLVEWMTEPVKFPPRSDCG